MGSGSTPLRRMAVMLPLDAGGSLGEPEPLDIAPLYRPLDSAFASLNIEGACASLGRLLLFQRGNSAEGRNAVAICDLGSALSALSSGESHAPPSIVDIDLGTVGDVRLCFADASPLPDGRTVFAAVAEATESTYLDGACVGSAVGVLEADLQLCSLQILERPHKIEGVDARIDGPNIELLLVTDADDPARPAVLYAATMSI
jgi:hypothetical protein